MGSKPKQATRSGWKESSLNIQTKIRRKIKNLKFPSIESHSTHYLTTPSRSRRQFQGSRNDGKKKVNFYSKMGDGI